MQRIFLFVIAVSLLSSQAFCQRDVVIFMNAQAPLGVGPAHEGATGGFTPGGFLVQGARNEFVVVNRKFLTEYSINIDGVTQLQNFPIQDLDEAANLTTPLSAALSNATKGATPKGGAGSLTSRTAQQILGYLLNPETSAQPLTDLNNDWITVDHEARRVQADDAAFDLAFANLLGPPPAPPPPVVPLPMPPAPTGTTVASTNGVHAACDRVQSAPALRGAQLCLASIYVLEHSESFPPGGPFTQEEDFRDLVVIDNDAVTMVQNLAGILGTQTQALANAIAAFDADAAQYRADFTTFAGNMQSAADAVRLFEDLKSAQRTEIRARLAQTLNPSGTTTVDPAELNELADLYYRAAHKEGGLGAGAVGKLRTRIKSLAGDVAGLPNSATDLPGEPSNTEAAVAYTKRAADATGVFYRDEVNAGYTAINVTLPQQLQAVNTMQSQVLARANEIYDRSTVPVPVRKQFNLAGNPGNLRVYFTVREVETFPRFAVPPITPQVQAAAPALPPAAPAATTPAPASTTTNPASTGGSNGVIVAHSVVEVHDLYHATMVGGFGFSGVGETTFSSSPVTDGNAMDGSACSTADPCTKIKVSRGADHATALVGFSFHFLEYDTFPHVKQPFARRFGIIGGSSVQNLNDYFGAIDLQFFNAIQIMGGGNFYRQAQLAPNYMNGGIYPGTPTFPGPQHWTIGAFGGLGLNLSIFRKAFGSVTGVGVGSTSKGS